MSTSLHDALRDLADEITDSDVPDDLAARAWAGAGQSRRRDLRRRATGLLAVAAAAALVLWLMTGAGGLSRVDTAPAQDLDRTGYPQRVLEQDMPALAASGRPLTAVVHLGGRRGAGAEEIDAWKALTPDGRLWSLEEQAARGALPGEEMSFTADPAVSPDGTRLALTPSRNEVVREDEQSKETRMLEQSLLVLDRETGERTRLTDPCGPGCILSALRWSPDGRTVAALGHQATSDRGVLVTASLDPGGRAVDVTSAEIDLDGGYWLVGWVDDQVLVVRHSREQSSLDVDGRLRPVLVDPADGTATALPPQPLWGSVGREGLEPDDLSVLHGELAVLDEQLGHGLQWHTYPLHEAQTVEAGVGWNDPDAPGGRARVSLSGHPATGDGIVVTAGDVDGPAYIGRSATHLGSGMITVMDPRLDVQRIVLAEQAGWRQASGHPFGTRTSWWSWHPVETAILVVAPLVLLGGWLVLRRRRRR